MSKSNTFLKAEILNTHFFVYKGKQFPFNFYLFNLYSKYFTRNEDILKNSKYIELLDHHDEINIDISDESINDFIQFVHGRPITIHIDNFMGLQYLSQRFEVNGLLKSINNYIKENYIKLSLELLVNEQQKKSIVSTKYYEELISEHFLEFIQDDRIFNLSIPILYRILSKYQYSQKKADIQENFDKIYSFLFKCLDKYGRQASVLFDLIEIENTDCLTTLYNNYSNVFDFHFLRSNKLISTFEYLDEQLKKNYEIENHIKLMIDNFEQKIKELKKDDELRFNNMKTQIESKYEKNLNTIERKLENKEAKTQNMETKMNGRCFYFTINSSDKKFNMPINMAIITKIPESISMSLISNLNYHVKSDVSEKIFQSFLDYLVYEKIPEIHIYDFHEFSQLSDEFGVLKDEIIKKKDEFGEDLIILSALKSNTSVEKSYYEEEISKKLDYYLAKCSEDLFQLPTYTLFNIFGHKSRELEDHDLAYKFIIQYSEREQNSDIFLLLQFLDGSRLSKNNFEESLIKSNERCGFHPKVDFNFLGTIIDNHKKDQEDIKKLNEEINELKTIIDQYENKINNITDQCKKEINTIQEFFNNKIDELGNIIKMAIVTNNRIEKENEELKCKINSMNEQIENKTKQFNDNCAELDERIQFYRNQNEQQNYDYQNMIKEINHKIYEVLQYDKLENNNYQKLKEEEENNRLEFLSLLSEFSCNSFKAPSTFSEPGILELLKRKENDKFSPPFIASTSSCDIYNLIDPETKDDFGFGEDGNFFIDFELEKAVNINGFIVFSSTWYFPKSFEMLVDGKVVKSIKEAAELNGPNKKMIIKIDPINGRTIRIIQTGPNWNKGNSFINIKRLEVLSSDEEYSSGVFATLIDQSETKNAHKCPVHITAKNYDFNSFYKIDSKCHICTSNEENSWFQIEFTRGLAVINGFRLKKSIRNIMKNYKIICTDDDKKPIDSWETVFEINEEEENKNQAVVVYEFECPSLPSRFVRLVQTGLNWNNKNFLMFFHFDIFGCYI